MGLVRHWVGWDVLEELWDGSRAGMEPSLCFTIYHPILLLKDRAGMAALAGALGLGDGLSPSQPPLFWAVVMEVKC